MQGTLGKLEQTVYNNRLKSIFQEIESADTEKQYLLLLRAAEVALLLGEHAESLSYLLQANLIQDSYETHVVLAYLYILQNSYDNAKKHLLYAKEKHYRHFEVFSWDYIEELGDHAIPSAIVETLEVLKSSPEIPSDDSVSFQDILHEDPLHATEIFHQWKKKSGLSLKYPELDNLSIKDWEKEFPDRREKIKEKEEQRQKQSIDLEELLKLGRMYFLENEFEKAAECFASAKDLYLLSRSS